VAVALLAGQPLARRADARARPVWLDSDSDSDGGGGGGGGGGVWLAPIRVAGRREGRIQGGGLIVRAAQMGELGAARRRRLARTDAPTRPSGRRDGPSARS